MLRRVDLWGPTRTTGPIVEVLRATDPRRGPAMCATEMLRGVPSARPRVIAVASYGVGPGLVPAPWTVDGVVDAARAGGAPLVCDRVGPSAPSDPVARRLGAAGLRPVREASAAGSMVALKVPGERAAISIPLEHVGAALCLVAPLAQRSAGSGGAVGPGGPSSPGPVASALGDYVSSRARGSLRDPVRAAVWIAAHVFCAAAVVLDATWWTQLDGSRPAATRLVAVDRCVGIRLNAPASPGGLAPADVDAWLVASLAGSRPADARARLHPVGGGATSPWPLVRTRARGLSGANLGGLWQRGSAKSAPRRGAAAVPGPLARAWHVYPERVESVP